MIELAGSFAQRGISTGTVHALLAHGSLNSIVAIQDLT